MRLLVFNILTILLFSTGVSFAQSNALTLFREPTISNSKIVFVFAGDLWSVSKLALESKIVS